MTSHVPPVRKHLNQILGVLPELPPASLSLALDFALACLERRLRRTVGRTTRYRLREPIVQYLSGGDDGAGIRKRVAQMYARIERTDSDPAPQQIVEQALEQSERTRRSAPPSRSSYRSARAWEHALLRAEHTESFGAIGHAPRPDSPIPGCSCVRCLSLAVGYRPSELGPIRELIRDLALLHPADREQYVRLANEERQRYGRIPHLLSPSLLARKASELPNAETGETAAPVGDDELATLREEAKEARDTSILEVAYRAGLSMVSREGPDYTAMCPFHRSLDPSLRLSPEEDYWHCIVCGRGGPPTQLVIQMQELDFPDAVRWVTEGRVA